jgi:hypothetical protein
MGWIVTERVAIDHADRVARASRYPACRRARPRAVGAVNAR